MTKIKAQDHPDYVGGWVWTKLELDWINDRIGVLEAALFQAQEAAKDLEAKLTKTEGWLNEAVWNYGELKREKLAKTSVSLQTWAGLTPSDFDWLEQMFASNVSNDFVFADIVCAIEAKLKEKNT